eukprot:5948232-Pyramimonas_sp.AAC.1
MGLLLLLLGKQGLADARVGGAELLDNAADLGDALPFGTRLGLRPRRHSATDAPRRRWPTSAYSTSCVEPELLAELSN